MTKQALSFLLLAFALVHATFAQTTKPVGKSIDEQVADLMKTMTLEDKIGQMVLADFGAVRNSITDIANYKIGNVMFGADSDPDLNTAFSWASLTDSLQKVALGSNLHIPQI